MHKTHKILMVHFQLEGNLSDSKVVEVRENERSKIKHKEEPWSLEGQVVEGGFFKTQIKTLPPKSSWVEGLSSIPAFVET